MKRILGLDLGTNSIGWALIQQNFDNKEGEILGMGSRIIPMSQDILGKFDAGQSISQTAERTGFRGVRRLLERDLLRRERLHRVLNVLGFLPKHYADEIDFELRLGQFLKDKEPKIAYKKNSDGKFEFIFQKCFEEMVVDFRESQPQLFYIKPNGKETKIPYDWTIYYLRKKALTQKIEKEELAWILLNFNQKRGYYQLRGEEEERNDTKEYCALLKIVSIEKGEKDKKNDQKNWYKMTFENGWEYSATFLTEPNWLNTEREFLITEEYDDYGNIKIVKDKKSDTTGKEKRKITPLPSFDEINLMEKEKQDKIYKKIKARTEITIANSGLTVGSYIYETLLQQPNQKIRGKLIRTIERNFYKKELEQILSKQIEFQPELFTNEKFNFCIRELYRNNSEHRNSLSGKNFIDLFIKDIIFYQRPLRSQKSNISNCSLEYREHKINKKDENGNALKNIFEKDKNGNDIIVKEYLKGIPKSNPNYQEFRIWQWLYNLKIYTREDDKDVTSEFISNISDLEKLFEFLMTKKEVGNKDIIEYLIEETNREATEQKLLEQFPKLNEGKIKTKVNTELAKKVKELLPKYRWNYVFDDSKEKEEEKSKKYPCNSTFYEINKRLRVIPNLPYDFLKIIDTKEIENKKTKTKEIVHIGTKEHQLWHIIYSVTDKNDFEKAIKSFAERNDLDENTLYENFKNIKPFESEYGSFSEKAIKKLLPLMRTGKYWNEKEIPETVKERVKSIKERLNNINDENEIESVSDDEIPKPVLKSFFKFKNSELINFIKGLQLYQASYLVYGRHSESASSYKWTMSFDIQQYLNDFRQHSLRNPIVEQVVTETLRVVKDIWEQEAIKNNIQPTIVYDEVKKRDVKSYPSVFKEIHIELGREMKNTAEDRKAITNSISTNESTNLRIKEMLLEFSQDDSFKNEIDFSSYCKEGENLDNYQKGKNPIRPYSRSQHDILKIFEDDILSQFSEQELKSQVFENPGKNEAKNVFEISRKSVPTKAEIIRYKLWLEQKYRSPYTGKIIPLGKLFTPAYEIEHVIPQSRYFDDSYNNKVICETEVNLLKGGQLGLEFIKKHYGQKVQIGKEVVTIFTEDTYKKFVVDHYKNSKKKRSNLLLEEIPDKMISRQLNDTRYISKFVSQLLSNIVRGDNNDNGINSKNLITVPGKITAKIKQCWGLNDKWNELILPRFERLNELNNTTEFTAKNNEGHTIPAIPLKYSKGFQFKRIDHRHHALDALVIACITRDHVQYLNNENAKSQKFHLQKGLALKLREFESVKIKKMVKKDGVWVRCEKYETREVPKAYFKPWSNFPIDTKNELEKIIVSFKQNLRVINKTTNYYQHFENGKKVMIKQEKGDSWAIRKPLHKATNFGEVNLRMQKSVSLKEALNKPKSIVKKDFKEKVLELLSQNKNEKQIKKYFEDNKDTYNDIDFSKINIYYFTNDIINDKGEIKERYFATRKELGSIFKDDKGKFKEYDKVVKTIRESVTDTGIQKILLAHLSNKDNSPKIAFSPEGIEEMNQNIIQLNKGVNRLPIIKVRWYEKADKFAVGTKGNKSTKFVEAAKGTNLFFAIYTDENGNRSYETIPFNIVIERQKQGLSPCEEINEKGYRLLFHLSPYDLIYVPTVEEQENPDSFNFKELNEEQIKRIFSVNDFSGVTIYFTPNSFAKNIAPKELDTSFDSKQSKLNGVAIKDVCWKLEIDRLGQIKKVFR